MSNLREDGFEYAKDTYAKDESLQDLMDVVQEAKDFHTYNDFDLGIEDFIKTVE